MLCHISFYWSEYVFFHHVKLIGIPKNSKGSGTAIFHIELIFHENFWFV